MEIGILVIVECSVDGSRVMLRSSKVAYIRHVRNIGKLLDLPPVYTAVFGYLYQSVISSDIYQSLLCRLFDKRYDVSIEGSRSAFCNCIHTPHPPHNRELVAVDLSRQVTVDFLPGIASIIATKKEVCREI